MDVAIEVDESVNKFDRKVHPFVKHVSAKTKNLSTEVKVAGVVETASGLAKTMYTKLEPTAKGLYTKYEPVAEQYAASAWQSLNQLPLFPKQTAEKGYKVSSYLPLVPTDRIAKLRLDIV
ncbi:hypothetical protein L1987_85621 [Smallanthus sonchifolius]|uniref:Uncharacterized protein n=1 Tax=Smallanthus sonchifolius TaxID=185202 RepID=A0ACB8Y177_9ASTR|nr:hypothetical protein L1987_85621 [Smallanthus sonchifolius]